MSAAKADGGAGLRVVAEPVAIPVYPLPADVSLQHFRSVDFSPHDLLGSRLAARAHECPAALGAWVLLFAHAFATQTPGGTLPVDDHWLASLAGYPGNIAGWGAVRGLALLGWSEVQVLDADGVKKACLRLAHPRVTEEAVRLWAAMQAHAAERADNRVSQARNRVRGQLRSLGAARGLFEAGRVEVIRAWIEDRGQRITRRAVEDAIAATAGPQSWGAPPPRGPVDN